MTPHDKGWLKAYLDYRKNLFLGLASETEHKSSHPDYSLYRLVQPTGLMYGESLSVIDSSHNGTWSERDRMKILLAESLISSSLLFHEKPVQSEDEFTEAIMKTVESIGNFYNNIFPEISIPAKTFFGRKKSALEVAEKILEKRINHTATYQGNFWTTFFHNSLLFLDVFIFGQWIHTNADKIVADFFRYERDELRFSMVKVIAAAAHANKVIAPEEQRLFEFFLQTTELPSERKREAMRIFAEGIAIEDINLPTENSWILKKFFLEIAILTIWADKLVEDEEIEFLKAFCRYFDFTEDELMSSMVSIEGFVLENWSYLEHLQDSQKKFEDVSQRYIDRVSQLVEKNRSWIARDLRNRDELFSLIRKGRTQELSPDENERIRTGLLEILRSVPTFAVTSLPQKFLTLPILMKILPKSVFAT